LHLFGPLSGSLIGRGSSPDRRTICQGPQSQSSPGPRNSRYFTHRDNESVKGSNDVIIPTVNSYVLQHDVPNAQLILYPDSNHGSSYQDPDLFLKHATLFLDEHL
jgi:hypothetical protein